MRRGIAFTFIAIVLAGVIIAFTLSEHTGPAAPRSGISIVESMNAVIDAFQSDLGRGLYITSYRTVIGQIEKITKTGEFINDTQASFEEGMINNTIDNVTVSALNGSTLTDWLDKTASIYKKRGYEFSYHIVNLSERQKNATVIETELDLDYNLTDTLSKRGFVRHTVVKADIPIAGLEDPVYYVRSLGRISNIIEFTNTRDLPTLIAWSANDSRYVTSDKSPSFLMRLAGNFSPSPIGIESIANGQRFLLQGIGTFDGRSSADAMFFSNRSESVVCVNGTPSWFRLDRSRLSDYPGAVNVTC